MVGYDYIAGTVVLTAVPEPGAAMLLLLSIGAFFHRKRCRADMERGMAAFFHGIRFPPTGGWIREPCKKPSPNYFIASSVRFQTIR